MRVTPPTDTTSGITIAHDAYDLLYDTAIIVKKTSKEPVCPRVELIFKIIIILLIIFLGFIKSKPC